MHAVPRLTLAPREEYLAGFPDAVYPSMVKSTIVEALAAAADEDGVILNLSPPEFSRPTSRAS
jgi:hypothetical protein